jgi:hypothetical protein
MVVGMPARPPKKPSKKMPATDKKIAAQGDKATGKVTEQRFAETGQTTRVQGHVASRGKRNQAKRDAR